MNRLTKNKYLLLVRAGEDRNINSIHIIKKAYDEVFDRLQEIEVEKEEGKLIKMPCCKGDMVYYIINSDDKTKLPCIITAKVSQTSMIDNAFNFHLKYKKTCEFCKDCNDFGDFYDEHIQDIKNGFCYEEWFGGRVGDFGKKVFLTYELSEIRLNELKKLQN